MMPHLTNTVGKQHHEKIRIQPISTGGRPGPLKGAAMGLSITRYPQAPPTDPLSTIVQVELFY